MNDPTTHWIKDDGKMDIHLYQRGERGFSDYDFWNFNDYLCFVILGGLKKFRESGSSYPSNFENVESWHDVLDKIILGFESKSKMSFTYILDEELEANWQEGAALFVEHFGALWD